MFRSRAKMVRCVLEAKMDPVFVPAERGLTWALYAAKTASVWHI